MTVEREVLTSLVEKVSAICNQCSKLAEFVLQLEKRISTLEKKELIK